MAYVDYTLDDLTPTVPSYNAGNLFDTSTEETGGAFANGWLQNADSNIRVVVVFSEPQDIYKIRVNNFHSSGGSTGVGVRNVDIYFSREEVTNEGFESRTIDYYFFGSYVLDEHSSVDEEDNQILDIYSWNRIVKPSFCTIPVNKPILTFSPQIYSITLGEIKYDNFPLSIDGLIELDRTKISLSELDLGYVLSQSVPINTFSVEGKEVYKSPIIAEINFYKIRTDTFDFSVPTDAGNSVIYSLCPDLALVGIKGTPRLFWQVDPAKVKTIYLFTLTGDADGVDDIVLPITSCQIRRRSGKPTYMSVVVKQSHKQVQAILARPNGQMILRKGVEFANGDRQTEEITRVDLEDIRLDEGAINYSITLSGHKTMVNPGADVVALEDVYSMSVEANGTRRSQSAVNLFIHPGDTVEVDEESYTAGMISYIIGSGNETMEIEEAKN